VKPYLVIQRVFETPEALQNELSKQFNKGYEVAQIWNGPGDYTNIAFFRKTSVANVRKATVAGRFRP
jgi:hypothetical protein